MAENKKLKVYISGPIFFLKKEDRMDECQNIFLRAKKDLEAFGYEVVNPFDNGLSHEDPWIRHIIKDLAMLDTCDMICYLHTWDLYYSGGSQIEKIAARNNRLIEIRQTKNDMGYHYTRLEDKRMNRIPETTIGKGKDEWDEVKESKFPKGEINNN